MLSTPLGVSNYLRIPFEATASFTSSASEINKPACFPHLPVWTTREGEGEGEETRKRDERAKAGGSFDVLE